MMPQNEKDFRVSLKTLARAFPDFDIQKNVAYESDSGGFGRPNSSGFRIFFNNASIILSAPAPGSRPERQINLAFIDIPGY